MEFFGGEGGGCLFVRIFMYFAGNVSEKMELFKKKKNLFQNFA